MKKNYDYIITGAGCAGLSLLYRLLQDPYFLSKKILVIDAALKNSNDRTWCFWEKEPDIFESIVFHRWNSLAFYSSNYTGDLQINPYTYKMIRGIDFYEFIKSTAAAFSNIEWKQARVKALINNTDKGLAGVELEDEMVYAETVFNSILFEPIQPKKNEFYFLQHFKGWEIETVEPVFDASKATFMDFRVSQQVGTNFIYVLPTSATTALVEYTLFTEKLLAPADYDTALKKYISEFMQITDYTVKHEEFGIIPMTNTRFPRVEGRIVYIGIAGGAAKASTGYAFKFIQQRTKAIVAALKKGESVSVLASFKQRKGNLYDGVLLHVLHHNYMRGDEIFAAIFKRNKASDVLRFLDDEGSLYTDLKIMRSVPTAVFLPAAMKELVKTIL
ncbi:MAG: lycopene cyclase [Sphingobacteriia bacterium]|nr:MAG: lycopene cyclase [Sphingobacteriia bacterium]